MVALSRISAAGGDCIALAWLNVSLVALPISFIPYTKELGETEYWSKLMPADPCDSSAYLWSTVRSWRGLASPFYPPGLGDCCLSVSLDSILLKPLGEVAGILSTSLGSPLFLDLF